MRLHHTHQSRTRDGTNCVTFSINKFILHSIYSNIVVAFASGILAAGFSHLIGSENWSYYGLFAGCATFAVYNAQRLIKSGQSRNTPWLIWVKKHNKVLYSAVVVSIVVAGLMLLIIGKVSFESLILLGIAGIISALYVLKINGISLRDRAYLKIHLIAIAWISVLLVFPVLNESPRLIEHSLSVAAVHYFYVIGITIPFDIRDLKYDDHKQRTIPQLLGITGAKSIALLSLVIFGVCMLWLNELLISNPLFYIAVVVQILLILFMTEKRGDIYCAGFIDGSIALLGLSYFFS